MYRGSEQLTGYSGSPLPRNIRNKKATKTYTLQENILMRLAKRRWFRASHKISAKNCRFNHSWPL